MVAYVAFVAIFNLCLGVLVARAVCRPTVVPQWTLEHGFDGSLPPTFGNSPNIQQVSLDAASTQTATVAEEAAPASAENAALVEPNAKSGSGAAPAIKEWTDLDVQLREMTDRAQLCRTAGDLRLLRQLAGQIRACAQEWYELLMKCLEGHDADPQVTRLMAKVDASAVELFVAQIETSLANLDAIDWTAAASDVVAALERELALLSKEYKSVLRAHAERAMQTA